MVYIFTFYFGSICGCGARMTIWKIDGWDVSIEGCRQLLGVVKYRDLISAAGLSVVQKLKLTFEKKLAKQAIFFEGCGWRKKEVWHVCYPQLVG